MTLSETKGKPVKLLGARVPEELHQRLYRVKAQLELRCGRRCAVSRLVSQALSSGLDRIERDLARVPQ